MSVREATERLKAARAAGFDDRVVFKLMAELIEEMGRSHLEMAAHLQRVSSALEIALEAIRTRVEKVLAH